MAEELDDIEEREVEEKEVEEEEETKEETEEEEVKAEVTKEEERTVVYLPVCRRVASEVICEEKGIRVAYAPGAGKPVLEEVTITYPKGGEESEVIVVTSKYKKGIVGPVEVQRKIEHEAS